MAILAGDWPINAATTSGNDLADKLNRLASGALTAVGGVLTGPLTLAADPTVALGAATKQYVDAKAATVQTGVDQAKADAAAAAASVNAKVSKTGDVMTGALRVQSPDGNVIFGTANGEDAYGSNYSRYQVTVAPGVVSLGHYYGGTGERKSVQVVASGVARFTIAENGWFHFYNQSGVQTMRLSPTGDLEVRGNITAFASI